MSTLLPVNSLHLTAKYQLPCSEDFRHWVEFCSDLHAQIPLCRCLHLPKSQVQLRILSFDGTTSYEPSYLYTSKSYDVKPELESFELSLGFDIFTVSTYPFQRKAIDF